MLHRKNDVIHDDRSVTAMGILYNKNTTNKRGNTMPKMVRIDFADTLRYSNDWTPEEIKQLPIDETTCNAYLRGEDWAEEEVVEAIMYWVRENDMYNEHIKDEAPLVEYVGEWAEQE